MASTHSLAQARRTTARVYRTLGEDVRRLREDAGLTRTALGTAAGVDATYLTRIEDATVTPTVQVYARLAGALGADLAAHLYPNTGPAIRDRHQARILEMLLGVLHPRWRAYPEVAVRRPARGWIDVVLHDPATASLVAVEIQSTLPRLEQLIRWSADKAASLDSWDGYAHLGPISSTSRLLIIRSTRATRDVRRAFGRQLELAYPAHPEDAFAALTGTHPWPGDTQLWVELRPEDVRFVTRRAAAHAIIRTT